MRDGVGSAAQPGPLALRCHRPAPLSFTSLVWWLGHQMGSTKSRLSKVQRLACLGIMGAFRTTPTSAIEVLVGLSLHPPEDEHLRLKTCRINIL